MQRSILALVFSLAVQVPRAQTTSDEISKKLLMINALIDESVVKKDLAKLEELYATDFVFTHGTGRVDNKTSWLKSVGNPDQQFVSRTHDSTKVELHDKVAIITGRLDIVRTQKEAKAIYGIWYVRVFAEKENQWRLISHRTTREWHLQ